MNGGFDNLRPEAHADEAIHHIHALIRLASANLEVFEEPIFIYGKAPLKVLYLIWRHRGGVIYTPEIIRLAAVVKISRRGVYDALKKLEADGFIERDGSMIRISARFCTNI